MEDPGFAELGWGLPISKKKKSGEDRVNAENLKNILRGVQKF
jgi:hypothetical protein